MRDEALASGKNRSTPIPNIPLRFEIMVTGQLQRGKCRPMQFRRSNPRIHVGDHSRHWRRRASMTARKGVQRECCVMPEQAEKNGSLTTREREIVLLAATGLSNKAIAYELKLSEGTVKVHMHNIFQKLGIRTRSGLIIQADLSVQRTADGSAQLADRRELTLQSWAR